MMKKKSLFFVVGLITILLLFVGFASADDKKMPFQGLICQEGATWDGGRVQLPDGRWAWEWEGYFKISDAGDLIDGYMIANMKWEAEQLPGPPSQPGGGGAKNANIKSTIVIVPERLCTDWDEVELVGPPFLAGTMKPCCIETMGTWVGKYYQTGNVTDLYPEHGPMIQILEAHGTGYLEGLTLKVFNIFAGATGGNLCISNADRKFTGYIKYKKRKNHHHNDNDD